MNEYDSAERTSLLLCMYDWTPAVFTKQVNISLPSKISKTQWPEKFQFTRSKLNMLGYANPA